MNIGYIFEKKDFWVFSPENFLVYDEFFPILLFLTISIVLALVIVSLSYFLSIQKMRKQRLLMKSKKLAKFFRIYFVLFL